MKDNFVFIIKWSGHPAQAYGPYLNEDQALAAAQQFADDNGWSIEETYFQAVSQGLKVFETKHGQLGDGNVASLTITELKPVDTKPEGGKVSYLAHSDLEANK